jgi:pimeloyl-ACP methyl ester carboxylesterase
MMKRVEWVVDGATVRGALHTATAKPSSRQPLLVLCHGLASSSVEFYDFPEKLAAGGYAVLTFDYRGHGTSDGERGIMSKDLMRADLEGGVEAMKKEYNVDTQRLGLVGHSAGGALAICAASHLKEVQCVIALAPLARARDEMNPFEFAAYNVMRVVNVPARLFSKRGLSVPYKIDYKRLYATSEAVERARKDDFLQHTLPVKMYKAFVRDLNGVACAENLHKPTLVMVAEYDVVVGKYNSRRVYDALPGPKKFVEVPKSGHSMCGDARSDFVAQHVLEFVDQYLKGIPAR